MKTNKYYSQFAYRNMQIVTFTNLKINLDIFLKGKPVQENEPRVRTRNVTQRDENDINLANCKSPFRRKIMLR